MRAALCLIGIGAAACRLADRAPASPASPPTCDAAAATLAASGAANRRWHLEARGEPVDPAEQAAFEADYAAIATAACQRDAWSAESIACFAQAEPEAVAEPGQGAINTCARTLTCRQEHAFIAAFRDDREYPGPDTCD